MKRSLALISTDSSEDNSYLSFYSSADEILNKNSKGGKKNKKNSFVIREIFERQKLQDKSLSEDAKVPLSRKLSRSCLPIKIDKVCKIKKKPEGKAKEKPNNKSLKRRKFSSPKLFNKEKKKNKKEEEVPDVISDSDPEMVTDDKEIEKWLKSIKSQEVYKPVTPQMLVDALQYPLLLRDGANIDVIVRRLRTFKKSLHPNIKILKEEVRKKLDCAKKLGIVKEEGGLYWAADVNKPRKLSPRKIDAFWNLYSKKWMVKGCAKTRKTAKHLPVAH